MDEFFSYLNNSMDRIDKQHAAMRSEFARLACEPCGKVPVVGDRVVVACGFLMMGHLWVRAEAEVIEAGDTSYLVRFANRIDYDTKKPTEAWVHQALITDVLGPRINKQGE